MTTLSTGISIETMLKSMPVRFKMRTTIALDDELIRQAQEYTGVTEKAALVKMGLTLLVQREAARRLAALGGSDPNATAAPRRRIQE
jgi:Arc/MetJ family transcription regulator